MLTKILFAIEIVVGLIVIVSILMQKSKADALSGLIQGSKNETFFAKNKGRTKEGRLKKITIILGVVFIVLAIVLGIIY